MQDLLKLALPEGWIVSTVEYQYDAKNIHESQREDYRDKYIATLHAVGADAKPGNLSFVAGLGDSVGTSIAAAIVILRRRIAAADAA